MASNTLQTWNTRKNRDAKKLKKRQKAARKLTKKRKASEILL